MDKNTPDPLRDLSNWMTPAEAAAERKRKDTEPKRIWGAVLLSGVVSGILGAAIGSLEAFLLFWLVSGVMLASWVVEKDGPGT